jgi:undecaprenyl phosphate N,N'-diacetylbacillosamine 1-phosphate transferase
VYRNVIKPFFDITGAFCVFLVTLPVFLVCCLVLLIANRGSIFFVQPRPGKNERIFKLIKFKTMTDNRDSNGVLLPDDARLTKTGVFIRRTSLDELPQLLNVMAGQMSFVGPRPLLIQYLPLYNERQKKRHLVKPGISGWAQVNGRNAVSWQQKFEYDVWYVENISFSIDIKILLLTVLKVVKADGISGGSSLTMENFKGN